MPPRGHLVKILLKIHFILFVLLCRLKFLEYEDQDELDGGVGGDLEL